MHPIAYDAIHTDRPISELVQQFYGPTGPLAERGWQIRPQQVEMSIAIAKLAEDYDAQPDREADGKFKTKAPHWGFVEAPCGTGKGLAYGVPGILLALRAEQQTKLRAEQQEEMERQAAKAAGVEYVPSQKKKAEAPKLLVTTANIALQEQLVKKDFPALAEMLGVSDFLRVSLLKGRNNYICRQKVRNIDTSFLLDGKISKLMDWMRSPECTGDREALPWDPGEIWPSVSSGTDECVGQACPHYEDGEGKLCYWRKAIQGYRQAHVIVTNHHFVALVQGIPTCLLAVDESHELENSIRATQGRQITPWSGKTLVPRIAAAVGEDTARDILDIPVKWLISQAAALLARNGMGDQDAELMVLKPGWLREEMPRGEQYAAAMRGLVELVGRTCIAKGCVQENSYTMTPPKYDGDEEGAEVGKLAKAWEQMVSLVDRFEAAVWGEPQELWPSADLPWAFWATKEKTKKGEDRVVINIAPADVAWATAALANRYKVAVLTTATMPDYPTQRISLGLGVDDKGAPAPRFELRLPSPYPLAEQGILVIPSGPGPKEAAWRAWASEQVVAAVRTAGGGTLVLASSASQMRAYTMALRNAAGGQWDVRMQGEMGRAELRRWFQQDVDGVLVATRSFFQGLDVQGDACRCVIIDRIPFAHPDDPVEAVVGQLLQQRSPKSSPYMLRTVPSAAMVLAQGAGRLIRAQEDRGAVVLLDTRVIQPGDGWKMLLNALPPFPISRDINDIRRRLTGEKLCGVVQATQTQVSMISRRIRK